MRAIYVDVPENRWSERCCCPTPRYSARSPPTRKWPPPSANSAGNPNYLEMLAAQGCCAPV